MSDEKVEVQDVKQDTANTASEEKQSVEAVPYARFKELVDERNTFKSELSSLKNQIDEQTKERKQKDLEARGEYDKVIQILGKEMQKTHDEVGQAIFVCKFLNADQANITLS